jgi:hypothetical protein
MGRTEFVRPRPARRRPRYRVSMPVVVAKAPVFGDQKFGARPSEGVLPHDARRGPAWRIAAPALLEDPCDGCEGDREDHDLGTRHGGRLEPLKNRRPVRQQRGTGTCAGGCGEAAWAY